MKKENNLILGTVAEVVNEILSSISVNGWVEAYYDAFKNYDFALADERRTENDDLETIKHNSSEWFGIKKIDTGFDSFDLDLFIDYYGGGSGHYVCVYDCEQYHYVYDEVVKAVVDAFDYNGMRITENDILIAECLKEDK